MALLCHCVPTSDRTVAALAVEGAASIEELGDACGVGTGCGGCHEALEAVLRAARLRLEEPSAA